MTQPKLWLITGISSGFGRALAERLMAAGEQLVGTFRQPAQIEAFNARHKNKASAIHMDVTQPDTITQGIEAVIRRHGRIDVLVNNAGYGLFGAVEEVSMDEARAQMETNFFGALAVTQAVLPVMRRQKSGHIVQISSVAGFRATPGMGLYNASKFALEGFSEALAQEVAPLGINVTIVEPGPFRTEWASGSSKDAGKQLADYAPTAHATTRMIHGYAGKQPGDPDKAAQLIMRVVNSASPPLRLPLGSMAIERIREKIHQLEQELAAWETASRATAFSEAVSAA